MGALSIPSIDLGSEAVKYQLRYDDRYPGIQYSVSLTIKTYSQSAVLAFSNGRATPGVTGATRGVITGYSKKSEKRLRLLLEDTIDCFSHTVTLTYPADFPTNGKAVRSHRRAFLARLKRYGVKDWAWALEWQNRGAPHFHMVVDRSIDPAWLSRAWFEVVGSGDPAHLRAGTQTEPIKTRDKAITYMVGYLKKDSQKKVPEGYSDVGRLWGSTKTILPKGEFTKRFKSDYDRMRYLRPIRKYYESKTRSWGYSWRMRKQGFYAWGCSGGIDKLIEEGFLDGKKLHQVCQPEKSGIRKVLRHREKSTG